MDVILAKSAGFCWGVRRAIERARHVVQTANEPVLTDGPLIHNEQMMAQLRTEGIREAEDPFALQRGVLILRAHGVSPERRARLAELPARIVDATCPDVARIQGLIRRSVRRGRHVIIFGDPEHAEVMGLLGHAQGQGSVIRTPEEAAALPDLAAVSLVAQSTQLPASYRRVADAVLSRFPNAEVLDTICPATKNRQEELMAIARESEALVVVGGLHSANTLRLVDLASGLRPTFHIQTPDQLRREDFLNVKTVGLTAGASTPEFIIRDVKRAMERM